jgi:fluoroquinolone resistance protein
VLENAELPGAVFLECDLAGADLRGALLAGADFRGSKLGGLQAGPKEMKGAIVDSLQAVQVAAILGVVVKEKGED